jgi:adenylyl cyclase-associated protein
MAVFQSLIQPINEALVAVTEIKDANRPDPKYNHLSTVADGIMLLAWVTVENKPHKHIDDTLGSAQFFGNKVLKEFKEKYVECLRQT